jgi:hypothetical protein
LHRTAWESSASLLTRRSLIVCSLFLLLQGLSALTSTGRVHVTDEASALFQTQSLVERGSLTVPLSTTGFTFYGQRDRDGRLRAPNGPLHAIVLVPFYLLGKVTALAPGVPDEARDVVVTFAVVLSSATFSALAAALFLTLLIRRDVPQRTAIIVTVAAWLGTPLFAYSAWLFSEPLAACLLIGAALCAFGNVGPVTVRRAALAGALVGACLLVRPAHALVIPIFVGSILVRDGRRSAAAGLALGCTAAIGVAIYLAWNTVQFGNPFDFGYPELADGGKRINGFTTPLLVGLAGFLISPGKSVFVHAPLLLAAIPAVPRLMRADRGLALLAIAAPLTYLFFYARYTQWEGGYCVGPRYLVPVLPFLLLAPAFSLASASSGIRRGFVLLTIAGAIVQSIGLATSFLEDQFANGYYDEHFDYRLTYAPLYSQTALFAHYLTSLLHGQPSPLGAGFDRWFIFLHKAGVSWLPIAAAACAAFGAAALGGWSLANGGDGGNGTQAEKRRNGGGVAGPLSGPR